MVPAVITLLPRVFRERRAPGPPVRRRQAAETAARSAPSLACSLSSLAVLLHCGPRPGARRRPGGRLTYRSWPTCCPTSALDAPPATVIEAAARALFVERRSDARRALRLDSRGYVDGLVADRGVGVGDDHRRDRAARRSVRRDTGARFEVRVGASRIVWGRLDEFQPTDVVNPIDSTRFLLEGRSEARWPSALVAAALSAALVDPRGDRRPAVPRRSRFDQLDEPRRRSTWPRRIRVAIPIERRGAGDSWRNDAGRRALTSTTARVDWGADGVPRASGPSRLTLSDAIPPAVLLEIVPAVHDGWRRFRDVRGPWGFRGEWRRSSDDTSSGPVQTPRRPRSVAGGGSGGDRPRGRLPDGRQTCSVVPESRSTR